MIRCKVTPSVDELGFIVVQMDWINVNEQEEPGEVLRSETFRLNPQKVGSSYFSMAAFAQGTFLSGTFYTDPEGRRHFHVPAEVGDYKAPGSMAPLTKG